MRSFVLIVTEPQRLRHQSDTLPRYGVHLGALGSTGARGQEKGRTNVGRTIKVMVATALMLALATGVAMGATRGDDTQAGPGTGLSPGQREEFVAGAKKTAGLNDAQIRAALEDPAALAAIPVQSEVLPLKPEPVAQPRQDGKTTSAAAGATPTCRSFTSQVNYKNTYGTLLASFKVGRTWCWDYSSVTYASVPAVSGAVTKAGAAGGWRYDGVLSRSDYFFTHNGRTRGGYFSYRKGGFTVCNAANGCYMRKTPQVRFWAYYDGRANQSVTP